MINVRNVSMHNHVYPVTKNNLDKLIMVSVFAQWITLITNN